ncbi:MAG: hypothetical protein OEX08_02645 [Candidatus Nomurabacteria bacterium]|nr:hypothetical protein [Candidatus Nomurabacteria bacterium]
MEKFKSIADSLIVFFIKEKRKEILLDTSEMAEKFSIGGSYYRLIESKNASFTAHHSQVFSEICGFDLIVCLVLVQIASETRSKTSKLKLNESKKREQEIIQYWITRYPELGFLQLASEQDRTKHARSLFLNGFQGEAFAKRVIHFLQSNKDFLKTFEELQEIALQPPKY